MQFSVDLLEKAREELAFLRAVDAKGHFYEQDVIECAIYRYERLWLPLLNATPEAAAAGLRPPLDVHWVWHVHMLSPTKYTEDVLEKFKKREETIGHSFEQGQKSAKGLWEATYPDEPFELSRREVDERSIVWKAWHTEFRYNILEAAQRQRVFFYQVSLPHYSDSKFLEEALLRYKRYLCLKQLNKETFLVPCYDIDLIWHAHQVHPMAYEKDCKEILGFVLPHDDSVNDRSEGSRLNNSYAMTTNLWKQHFSAAFAKPGAMYRGDPPNGKLFPTSEEKLRQAVSYSRFDVRIQKLEMGRVPWQEPEDAEVILSVASYRHGNKMTQEELHTQLWRVGPDSKPFVLEKELHLDLDDFQTKALEITVRTAEKKGLLCCAEHQNIAAVGDGKLQLPMEESDGVKLEAQAKLYDAKSKKFVASKVAVGVSASCKLVKAGETREATLGILPGTFYDTVMPETVESMWGPVPMKKLPDGEENKCKAVVHR